ncbi:MAG: ATP-binding protein [Bacteroidia bacterium]
MLLEFKVSNYKSIAEEQTISFVPSKAQSDYPDNILHNGKHEGLNVLALYGPNNSGKSNFLKAIATLDQLIFLAGSSHSTARLPYDPNLLIEGYKKKPTEFEITFVIEGVRYRYGVTYNESLIIGEWLYRKKSGREVELFFREKDVIQVSEGFKGKSRLIETAIEATRENALFLSFCDILNVQEAKLIFSWFRNLISVDGLDTTDQELNTITLLESDIVYREKIIQLLRGLGLGFIDLAILKKTFDPMLLPEFLDRETKESLIQKLSGKTGVQVNTIRHIYKEDGNISEDTMMWPLDERESAGTKKAFSLSGPAIYSLLNGGILVIDEIEAKLHTKITSRIVELFLSEETNPKGAQLLFATHDTNLLRESTLRRDQINFTELNHLKATELYSLSDFKYFNGNKERPDTDKEKRYLEGRYGAIPKIGAIQDFLKAV